MYFSCPHLNSTLTTYYQDSILTCTPQDLSTKSLKTGKTLRKNRYDPKIRRNFIRIIRPILSLTTGCCIGQFATFRLPSRHVIHVLHAVKVVKTGISPSKTKITGIFLYICFLYKVRIHLRTWNSISIIRFQSFACLNSYYYRAFYAYKVSMYRNPQQKCKNLNFGPSSLFCISAGDFCISAVDFGTWTLWCTKLEETIFLPEYSIVHHF